MIPEAVSGSFPGMTVHSTLLQPYAKSVQVQGKRQNRYATFNLFKQVSGTKLKSNTGYPAPSAVCLRAISDARLKLI